jgi:hypothetical protein
MSDKNMIFILITTPKLVLAKKTVIELCDNDYPAG